MVKIHEDKHYDFIFTKVFRRVLTATRRTSYYQLTSYRITCRLCQTAASAPPCTALPINRSSINIMCTVYFDFPSSDDKIHTVNRLLLFNKIFDLWFAITVDVMLDVPHLPSSFVTHAYPSLNCHSDCLNTNGRLHLSDRIP